MSQEYKMYNVRNIDNIKVMYFYGDGQKRWKTLGIWTDAVLDKNNNTQYFSMSLVCV